MMNINTIVTLDQLEDSEYLFRFVSTILPSLCLDYKVDPALFKTYVHPFDALFSPKLGKVVDEKELANSIKQVGINYLLDLRSNSRLFRVTIEPGKIEPLKIGVSLTDSTNPISNTHSFNDLPRFTRCLVKTRLREPEGLARFIGGYVRSTGSAEIKSKMIFPDVSFDNDYLLTLTYPEVQQSDIHGFRARLVNGIMVIKDLYNLIGVRELLTDQSRRNLDTDFDLERHAKEHNISLSTTQNQNLDISTVDFKHLVIYYMYFSSVYDLDDLTYKNNKIVSTTPNMASIVASSYFKNQIPILLDVYDLPTFSTASVITLDPNTGTRISNSIAIDGSQFVDISSHKSYYLTLLSMFMRSDKTNKLDQPSASMFWDGISYEEYKNKKLSDIIFMGSACYVFGLYDKNETTYCSMLSDLIASGEVPTRVCFLPRVVGNRTVPELISEVLTSINSISPKDFPRKSASAPTHIGLSESSFMRFFQLLRLMANKTPEIAVKEVLMAYAGIKLDDKGSPHHIKQESYQDFSILLFAAMGFKVSTRKGVFGSNNYTTISVYPRVSKQYITSMLSKAGCSKAETEKLISSSYDLLNFMLSAGSVRDYNSYRFSRRYIGPCRLFGPCPIYFGGDPSGDEPTTEDTLIHITQPMNILDRIDTRGIFSATTGNEMVDIDIFLPENAAFKNNLTHLIESESLCGDTITHAMPLNILDRIVTVAGTPYVSISELMDNIGTNSDDCNATDEVIDMINNALKNTYLRNTSGLVTQTFNAIAVRSEKQMGEVKQASYQVAMLFKNLARSIYTLERIFKTRISDEVKMSLLEKYKEFANLSKSVYQDLISLESLKALMYIIKRSGRNIEDGEIGPDEVAKAYELIRPKIMKIADYYSDINRSYFNYMKKNLNMTDGNSISFDGE
uniref:Virion core protein P4a n=1 Tax=Baiomys poxvirus TaxID=2203081 RepID=A0A2U8U5V7_9POXV|nr:virion core protein P4a [Baiomys poxvirus]